MDSQRTPSLDKGREAAHPAVVMRLASSEDARDLDRLAQLDSGRAPHGPVLVAEVEGQLIAALPLCGGRPISDPFRPTADVLRLLELRAVQLRGGPESRRWSVRGLLRWKRRTAATDSA